LVSRNVYILGLGVILLAIAVVFLYQTPAEELESQLRVYGVADPEDVRPWLDAFEEKYPGTTVEYVNKPPPPLYQQLISEVQAGQSTADVVMITLPIQRQLTDQGFFEAYESPEADAYPDNFKDTEGFWTAVQVNPMIQVYNPDTLSMDDLPTTIEELLDEKWTGKLTIHDVTRGSVGTSWLATLKEVLGDDWQSFIEELAALEPARFSAFEDVGRTVYEGEYEIGLTVYVHDFLRFKATGAPIERVEIEGLPVLFTVTPVSLMNNASNPVTAKRFIDFILSEEGQELVGNTEVRIAARSNIDTKYTLDKVLPDEDLVLFPNDDAYENVESYTEQFTNLYAG